jgi:DNA-binding response OmpR family regulator
MNNKILLVEDEEFLSNLIGIKLKELKIDVLKAKNGEEALDLIKKDSFDLILLDIILPKMNGFDFLKELKNMNNKTPVVVITILAQETDINKFKEFGAMGYISKSKTTLNDLVLEIQNKCKQFYNIK